MTMEITKETEFVVVEDGIEQTITQDNKNVLLEKGIIYCCDECSSFPNKEVYHISPDYWWEDIDALIGYPNNDQIGTTNIDLSTGLDNNVK